MEPWGPFQGEGQGAGGGSLWGLKGSGFTGIGNAIRTDSTSDVTLLSPSQTEPEAGPLVLSC